MSWKKVVNRNVAIGLGIICIILIAGLLGIFAYYSMQVNSLNDEKNTLNTAHQNYASTHSYNNSEYDGLTNYKNQLETWLAGNITQLQNQINDLRTPRLVKVNFGQNDNRPWFGTPYLSMGGILINFGSNTAHNCRLHVVLYQSGGAIAKDTYVNLGTINGNSWVNVNTSVYYEGSALTGWTITPEWTS